MNIVHLLSQTHLTGAEVYATQLIQEQIKDQHQVWQISNGFFNPTLAQKIQLEVETRSKITFIKNVFHLRSLIKKNQIHILHAHSRAASKLAFYSCLGLKVGYVSTVHGRQHPSFSKKLLNQYGHKIITVCDNLKKQIQNDFKYDQHLIKTIPNGIDTSVFYQKNELNKTQTLAQFEKNTTHLTHSNTDLNSKKTAILNFKIAVIGRATGPKKIRTINIIKALFKHKHTFAVPLQINLIGTTKAALFDELKDDLKSVAIEDLNNINFIEHSPITSELLQSYHLIIGSGRVALEALLSGVPCIAFGEALYLGLCRNHNYHSFKDSNFGDILPEGTGSPTLHEEVFKNDLREIFNLDKSELVTLKELAYQDYSLQSIARRVFNVYRAAYFKAQYSAQIPVLMYHKIPLNELDSPHKIYVTADNFKKHISFFKKQNFTTLTFSELSAYSKAQKDFKNFPKKPLILTFDDGYVDNLQNANCLLKEAQYKAQIFLLADSTITHNSWDESLIERADLIVNNKDRRQWISSQFEIGSHGIKHDRITEMSRDEALQELIISKQKLEQEFNTKVSVFAYTFGDTNEQAGLLAEEAGYDFAVNTDTGGLEFTENFFHIFRINMFPHENTLSLWKKTRTWYRKYYYFKRKK